MGSGKKLITGLVAGAMVGTVAGLLRACPKCGGAVVVEEDRCALGQIWMVSCLNCVRHRDLNWQPNPTLSREQVGRWGKNKKEIKCPL